MENIKFRAWYIGYTDECGEEFKSEMRYTDFMEDTWCCDLVNTDRLKIMQYIGMKDKNGKDIYEGDILQIQMWKDSELINVYKNICVSWGYMGWAFESNDDINNNFEGYCEGGNIVGLTDLIYDFPINFDNAEVIGNKYEDTNLLYK